MIEDDSSFLDKGDFIKEKVAGKHSPDKIRLPKDHPYYRMTSRGYVYKARLNMAEHLGRCIGSDEYIYYKDGNCFNEEISNLRLCSHKELNCLNYIRQIEMRIERLTSYREALLHRLGDIQLNNPPCRCNRCRQSLDARQARYRMSQ